MIKQKVGGMCTSFRLFFNYLLWAMVKDNIQDNGRTVLASWGPWIVFSRNRRYTFQCIFLQFLKVALKVASYIILFRLLSVLGKEIIHRCSLDRSDQRGWIIYWSPLVFEQLCKSWVGITHTQLTEWIQLMFQFCISGNFMPQCSLLLLWCLVAFKIIS